MKDAFKRNSNSNLKCRMWQKKNNTKISPKYKYFGTLLVISRKRNPKSAKSDYFGGNSAKKKISRSK